MGRKSKKKDIAEYLWHSEQPKLTLPMTTGASATDILIPRVRNTRLPKP